MRVAVAPTAFEPGVKPPGSPDRKTGVPLYYDWRAPIGSPENTANIRDGFEVLDLTTAIHRRYDTDAHLVMYTLTGPDGRPLVRQPRVTKEALDWIIEQGFELWIDTIFVDFDNPNHEPWADAPTKLRDDFERLLQIRPPSLIDAGIYDTRAGWRAVQPLDEPVRVADAEPIIWGYLEELMGDGLEPDLKVCDWTRHFRLPRVRRRGKQTDALIRLEQMRPRVILPKAGPVARSGGPTHEHAA